MIIGSTTNLVVHFLQLEYMDYYIEREGENK